MSFLGGGSADCGPVNPMAGLMKQFGQDRSLQQVLLSLRVLCMNPLIDC